jgi:predicted DNA-binding transcriptional regulator AlpA
MPKQITQAQFVNSRGAAALLGVSVRTLAELRKEPWFPPAIAVGPRTIRFSVADLLAAMARAPRVRTLDEPQPLRSARLPRAEHAA